MNATFNIFTRGIKFVRDNPQIVYTIFLVVVIPLAFFFTSEQFLEVARDNQNRLERSRIGVLQDVFVLFAKWNLDQPEFLRDRVRVIAHETETMTNFQMLGVGDGVLFPVLVSMNTDEDGTMVTPDPLTRSLLGFASSQPAQSFAAEFFKDGIRYWRSARAITATSSNMAVGYVLTDLSMAQGDAVARQHISNAYITLAFIILLIVLLLARQARIIDYATLYQRLKEVDTMKDDFVSMAAHELRSPLTIIRGYTEILGEEKGLSEGGRGSLGNIDHAATQLNSLIGDILDVAKLQEGRMSFEMKTVDVSQEIASVVDSFMRPAKDKGLTLTYVPTTLPLIFVDMNRFHQVLINLVGNAVKYTPQGSVTVSVAGEGDRLSVRVSDTGMGISAEEQQKLFQKFYRVKNAETREITGTGLGLWITAQIVKTMKGTISVESIKGKGTDFIVSFPIVVT
jgi:signal transduction histidine kinase